MRNFKVRYTGVTTGTFTNNSIYHVKNGYLYDNTGYNFGLGDFKTVDDVVAYMQRISHEEYATFISIPFFVMF